MSLIHLQQLLSQNVLVAGVLLLDSWAEGMVIAFERCNPEGFTALEKGTEQNSAIWACLLLLPGSQSTRLPRAASVEQTLQPALDKSCCQQQIFPPCLFLEGQVQVSLALP